MYRALIGIVLAMACQWGLAQDSSMSEDEARKILAAPLPAKATNSPEALDAWRKRDAAALRLGQLDARVEALRQLADAAQDGEARYSELARIVAAITLGGQFERGVSEQDAIVEDRRIGPGRRALSAAYLAREMAIRRDNARSQRYMARAKSLASDAKEDEIERLPDDPVVATLYAEAIITYNRGDTSKALQLSRQLINHADLVMRNGGLSDKRRRAALDNWISADWNHGIYLESLGRRDEAIAFAKHAIQRANAIANPKPSMFLLARLEGGLARAFATAGDYETALERVNSGLDLFRQSGTNEHDNSVAVARQLRGRIYLGLGRYADMVPEFESVQRSRAANPTVAGNISALAVR